MVRAAQCPVKTAVLPFEFVNASSAVNPLSRMTALSAVKNSEMMTQNPYSGSKVFS